MNWYEVTKPLVSDDPPAWGTLPVEQYLLRNWDADSPLSPADQRQHLVRAFIQEDSIIETERITPSAEQMRTILGPWRPQKLRQLANKLYVRGEAGPCEEFFFLRTHYAGGAEDDEKLHGWLNLDEFEGVEIPPGELWYTVLDYAELFDLGENDGDWQRVYDVFPELAAPGLARDIVEEGDRMDWVLRRVESRVQEEEPEEEDWAEVARQIAQRSGHKLLVVDREAFETDELGLVFRDAKGNVIRQGRVRPDELNELLLYEHTKGALRETRFWLDSEVGEKYRVGGEVVREIVSKASEGSRQSGNS